MSVILFKLIKAFLKKLKGNRTKDEELFKNALSSFWQTFFRFFFKIFFVSSLFYTFVRPLPILHVCGVDGRWADIYLRKDVYYVFVLDTLETSQLFNHCQRQGNGRCLRGMLYTIVRLMCKHKVCFVVIHIGVGYLGVARSDSDGQCEGLRVWDE